MLKNWFISIDNLAAAILTFKGMVLIPDKPKYFISHEALITHPVES